jgi:hypothetical protein
MMSEGQTGWEARHQAWLRGAYKLGSPKSWQIARSQWASSQDRRTI